MTSPPKAAGFAPRQVDEPRPGYFTIRYVKRGPVVPARITEDFGMFAAYVDGVLTGPPNADPFKVKQLAQIWHYGTEITQAEHDDLVARKASRPDPRKPYDPATMPPPF